MRSAVNRARKSESGFTLIELLIVIVILGILAAIVVFSVRGITNKGNVAACKADVETVTVAEEAYYAGSYGPPAAPVQNGVTTATYATIPQLVLANLLHSAPVTTNGYTVTADSGTGAVSATGLAGCP